MFTSETETKDDMPNMSVILVIQLPRRFPNAILCSPCFKAWIVVANSGNEVPSPMIVAPMIEDGNPMKSANSTELSTAMVEKNMISARPNKNLIPMNGMFSFLFDSGIS